MADRRFVRPVPGLKVRDPDHGAHLSEAGTFVPWSPYWEARLQDRSITVVDPPPAEEVPTTTKPKK